jgi:tRNA threonylcarbamoyl adenosine modification protein YeaZ
MAINFLSIQGSYTRLQLALFENIKCLQLVEKNDGKASSFLIPLLDELLKKQKKTLADLHFIAVDKGPGAFTSLRVTITTINGISFATGIPLIGVCGLQGLFEQYHYAVQQKKNVKKIEWIVVLLNAYNNDVYFLIEKIDMKNMKDMKCKKDLQKKRIFGCKNITALLIEMQSLINKQKVFFVGNAASLHQRQILDFFRDNSVIENGTKNIASAYHIGMLGLQAWEEKKGITNKIVPQYLKTQSFSVSRKITS